MREIRTSGLTRGYNGKATACGSRPLCLLYCSFAVTYKISIQENGLTENLLTPPANNTYADRPYDRYRNADGGIPNSFLKALLKWNGLEKPN